jgi:hypothetical protein
MTTTYFLSHHSLFIVWLFFTHDDSILLVPPATGIPRPVTNGETELEWLNMTIYVRHLCRIRIGSRYSVNHLSPILYPAKPSQSLVVEREAQGKATILFSNANSCKLLAKYRYIPPILCALISLCREHYSWPLYVFKMHVLCFLSAIKYCDEMPNPCGDLVGVLNCINLDVFYKCECRHPYIPDEFGRQCIRKKCYLWNLAFLICCELFSW